MADEDEDEDEEDEEDEGVEAAPPVEVDLAGDSADAGAAAEDDDEEDEDDDAAEEEASAMCCRPRFVPAIAPLEALALAVGGGAALDGADEDEAEDEAEEEEEGAEAPLCDEEATSSAAALSLAPLRSPSTSSATLLPACRARALSMITDNSRALMPPRVRDEAAAWVEAEPELEPDALEPDRDDDEEEAEEDDLAAVGEADAA